MRLRSDGTRIRLCPRLIARKVAVCLLILGLSACQASTADSRVTSPTNSPEVAKEENALASEGDCRKQDTKTVKKPGQNLTQRSVAEIQAVMGAKADGVYGIDTTMKVKIWQRCNGLKPTGDWGPKADRLAFAEKDAAEAAAERWHCSDATSYDKDP